MWRNWRAALVPAALGALVALVATAALAENGLRGEFYKDTPDQWGAFGSDPNYPQPYWRGISPNIDFVFASDVDQHFSARWTGYLYVPPDMAGEIEFKTVTDDGVRLIIDGQTIIDFWRLQAHQTIGTPYDECTHTATVTLSEGFHSIVFEYFEWDGGVDDPDPCKLYWNGQIIPSQYFFTEIPHSGNLQITDVSHSPNYFIPPAGETVTISYTITEDAKVRVEILDSWNSSVIRTLPAPGGEWQTAGEHSVVWDGCNENGTYVPPGVYTYRIIAENDGGKAVYDPGAPMKSQISDLEAYPPEGDPYQGATKFTYTVIDENGSRIRLRIGQQNMMVRNLLDWRYRDPGPHTEWWDNRDEMGYYVPYGTYIAAIWSLPVAYNGIIVGP